MRIIVVVTVATLLARRDVLAQSWSAGAQAIPVVTRADPTATRSDLTEGYVSQPVVMAHASAQRFRFIGTLNLEGLTLKRGELLTGGYGEGYVDRRHPHSYVHELLVGVEDSARGAHFSLFGGRGFAPFGSDDPMARPLEKYPVNHHLAQVLERVVVVGAVRAGRMIGEIGAFNGDEPTGPGAAPRFSRFGDSWAARVTALPLAHVELSASGAAVTSAEVPAGHGLDQTKWSSVARYDRRDSNTWTYGLVEWARTNEHANGVATTTLSTWLGEVTACRRDVIAAARLERTSRPEEEPADDPFRTPRPPSDLSNLGVSRWTTLTVSLSAPRVGSTLLSGRPFIEVSRVQATRGNPPGIFDADLRYGDSRMWMLSAGIRLRSGSMHDRMGRYGAALASNAGTTAGVGESHDMPGMPGMQMPEHAHNASCSL